MHPQESDQAPNQQPPQSPPPDEQSPWQFHNDEDPNGAQADPSAPTAAAAPSTHVEWTASEFVAHQKGAGWYLLLAIIAGVAAAAIYLLTGDMVAAGVILFAALAFGIFAARKPRVLRYRVDSDGLHIEDKLYHYGNFKSFAVIEEDAIHSVTLLPMKRFMPALSVYYAPEDESKIVDALADYLPLQPAQNDLIDRLMRKIRF